MSSSLDNLLKIVAAVGGEKVRHYGRSYVDHLRNTHDLVANKELPQYMCLAGAAHSIYGTERFPRPVKFERREEITDAIGSDAERIAYLNCMLSRGSLDDAVLKENRDLLCDRFSRQPLPTTDDEFRDLCLIHLFDWIEQLPSRKGRLDRDRTYRAIAARYGYLNDYIAAVG